MAIAGMNKKAEYREKNKVKNIVSLFNDRKRLPLFLLSNVGERLCWCE
jgi:hypothetical protein